MKMLVGSKKILLSIGAVTLIAAAGAAYELVPRCSTFAIKLSGIIAKTIHNDNVATAPSCDAQKNLKNEVFFVSCGGFF